ncbi:MAG: PDZ domain-containing protein [Gammaproteobacteria bacterium]|nr:MAG: PDZ domain-containing protein [Gammaproteobacteria bacterium]
MRRSCSSPPARTAPVNQYNRMPMKKRFFSIIVVLLVALLQGACVSAPVAEGKGTADDTLGSALVVETPTAPTFSAILERVRKERLLYVGETHTRNADHLLQLAVFKALPPERAALGVEWFQARFQPVLDDFVAGRIDEAEMLRRTEYFTRWGFDYRLYRPILQYARRHHIPIIALNASRELTGAIRDKGIAGLEPEMQRQLPDGYDYSDRAYDRILRGVFDQHRREDGDFQRFREVQLTWDETMAQHVAQYLQAHPERQLLVLAGRGHIAARHGIPNRVTRRSGVRGVVILSHDPRSPARNEADYLVLDQERALPSPGMMGAFLDIGKGIVITGFTEGSIAKAAGLEKGDRITAVDGREVKDYVAFKLAMLEKRPGDRLQVTVERKGWLGGQQRMTVSMVLKPPAAARGSVHSGR